MCQTPLSNQTRLLNEVVIWPEMIYPFTGICQQLATLYLQPGFESSLWHWINRLTFNNILTDIYDRQIWKNFKNTNDENFFWSEIADLNISLMINLDWFQPYEGSIHSTGVIYTAVCNLLRNIWFKCKNLLILGLLPDLNKVSLHKINHYLVSIVNDLESF